MLYVFGQGCGGPGTLNQPLPLFLGVEGQVLALPRVESSGNLRLEVMCDPAQGLPPPERNLEILVMMC